MCPENSPLLSLSFCRYTPVTCQLVKEALYGRTDLIDDVFRLLQTSPSIPKPIFKGKRQSSREKQGQLAVVVCIVGGITRAEVSAFRTLGSRLGVTFILASTQMITGNKLAAEL